MGFHRFNAVEFVTNGVGYVSTSFPVECHSVYLDLAHALRDCTIDGRPIYRRFTPTLFYTDAAQAANDQLNRGTPPVLQLDFNRSPTVAVFGGMHSLFKPCFHHMGRIVCAVGTQNIDAIEWGLSVAAARLHVKQYHGLTWEEQSEQKQLLVTTTADKIISHLRERRQHARDTVSRPQGSLCGARGTGHPA